MSDIQYSKLAFLFTASNMSNVNPRCPFIKFYWKVSEYMSASLELELEEIASSEWCLM